MASSRGLDPKYATNNVGSHIVENHVSRQNITYITHFVATSSMTQQTAQVGPGIPGSEVGTIADSYKTVTSCTIRCRSKGGMSTGARSRFCQTHTAAPRSPKKEDLRASQASSGVVV